MTTYNLSEWSQEASNNNAASPAGAPEGWTGKEVNNTVRENMAVVRQWYDDPEWLSLLEDMSPRGAKSVTWVSDSIFRINTIDEEMSRTSMRVAEWRCLEIRQSQSPPSSRV